MGESDGHIPSTSQVTTAPERPAAQPAPSSTPRADPEPDRNPRGELAKAIPRRPRVAWWLGVVFAVVFAALVVPAVTANRWLASLGASSFEAGEAAPVTIRVAPFTGYDTQDAHIGGGGIVIARGMIADASQRDNARAVIAATPRGPLPYVAFFMLAFVLGAIFTHHMRRSIKGRLVRVQIVSLVSIAILALAVKFVMLTTATSVLVVPVALFAMVPTLVLDRVVGLATGILAAVVTSLLIPFDVGVALLLLVASSTAGLVVPEQPKYRWRAVLTAGAVTTLFTAGTYVLLTYVTKGTLPAIGDPLRSPLIAAVLGPAIATVLAVPLVPLYQLLVGEITRGKLIELEDLSNPLLAQIAERAPGTWQHSLMMANLAEIAANAIGASGRLVRVGAYYHDLGKSLQPKYFIENLEPGETSPHDQLPPEVSCDAIFAHVTEGIVTARKSGLHERIVDFMHMHHGNGVLEYFWAKCREQGNPHGFTVEAFRYPGHPPQSRETAILAICDAVEAASRTLKKPDATAIDSLVQRIVYGKLHLGQLDESGLSMSDLRRISDSLRETIRHANHGRIEYPWQKAQQDASAGANTESLTATGPRLDSLDRYPRRDTAVKPIVEAVELEPRQPEPKVATPPAGHRRRPTSQRIQPPLRSAEAAGAPADALAATADLRKPDELAIVETAPAIARDSLPSPRSGRPRTESERAVLLGPPPDVITPSMFGGEPPPAARKRAATLPPTTPRRAPTVPPPSPVPGRRSPTLPPMGALAGRSAGPPPAADLENAITNPPPFRRTTLEPPAATRLPAVITGGPRPPPTLDDDDASITGRHAAVEDPGRTEPSIPVMRTPPPASDPAITLPGNDRDPKWAAGLAARIDAQLESDEWSIETPVVAPTKAELRALLGVPDPTRKQSIDEIERLHAASLADRPSEPEILQRRPPPGTAEVDPDDIEAAIELAPPARRNSIAVAKPKKPQ